MPTPNTVLLQLEVPVIVQLGERKMKLSAVRGLAPGSIIELNKDAEEDLDLLVNNRMIGSGNAVKVGENFGIRIRVVGDEAERLAAATGARTDQTDDSDADDEAAALAESLLSGQG